MLGQLKISPFDRNQRSTAVGQNQEQVCTTSPMDSSIYGKALTLKGVTCASDNDAWRKALVMGSMWLFPSITSIMTGWWPMFR